MPALQELVSAGMRVMSGGDRSEWDAALGMPHYNARSMPALSLHTGAHFAQWAREPAFRLFDHGSAPANVAAYGEAVPPSVADLYRLFDLPVDLVAGTADGVVRSADVAQHAQHLRAAGVQTTYVEFK